MPISEDEFDRCSVNEATSTMSTMSKAELRKSHKPIMEKKRRARINQCLNEIKSLILEAMKKDPARHSKLEKADILEMAVKHLQNVQRQQLAMAMAGDPSVLRKFKTGFNECAEEVGKFIVHVEGSSNPSLKQRVNSHLTKCMTGIEQIARLNGIAGIGTLPLLGATSNLLGLSLPTKTTDTEALGDQNNNPQVHLPQGIQLIPSRLPSGEIAFLVPNSRNLQCFSNVPEAQVKIAPINVDLPKRESAFMSVIPSSSSSSNNQEYVNTTKPLSPPLSPSSPVYTQNDDAWRQNLCRTPSPRGFRPVNPKLHRSYQSAFASTAKSHEVELKNITYPINKYATSPKKSVEPLCIITNQGERFKQAQVPNDTMDCEENARQGIKRKLDHQGLLTVASSDFGCPSKVRKTSKDSCVGLYRNTEQYKKIDNEQPSSSGASNEPPRESNIEANNDMWRPW